ncbi:MAG TPA: hypothetical protein VL381_08790 [Rhodocyclaceae bacterium]|nr:hypothetical protein [Rhodocyclaceae bacterium]
MFASFAAAAAPRLRCEISQGGEMYRIEMRPVKDPYSVKPIDIGSHFRFKAVVIGDEQHIEYINLYTYYKTEQQAVLLQSAQFFVPTAQVMAEPSALTGKQYLYSPLLERELQYGCAVFEVRTQ